MNVTFDGLNKLMIMSPGVVDLPIKELYGDWKKWAQLSDNSKYLPAFSVVGGEPTIGANTITPYFFIQNSWKIRPQEANHTLEVDGILIAEEETDAFVDTIGVYRINIQSIVPLYTETVIIDAGLDAEEHAWIENTNTIANSIDTTATSIDEKVDIIDTVVDSIETKVDIIDTVVDDNATKIAAIQTLTVLLEKLETNKAVINGDGSQVTIYDDNGTSILFQYTISSDKKTRTPL